MFSESLIYITISGSLFYIFYKWATVNKEYFLKRNLKHLEPKFLIGNMLGLFVKRHRPSEFMDSLYYRYPREKYVFMIDLEKNIAN